MKITREELYEMVWAEPMISICKKYGLSDNGLRKHCKKMNIPTPPVGYWEKLKHGKNPEKTLLPKQGDENKQSTDLTEREIVLSSPPDRKKVRELEILSNDTSVFSVPVVLYAKDPIIIDTLEKFRQESENSYLTRNPFKVKTGPALDVSVSDKSRHRALSIFETIIRGIRFRGGDFKIKDSLTYAVINSEEIQISITEKHKQVPNTEDSYPKYNYIQSGQLCFNIFYGYREKDIFKDSAYTKLEDKIIPIMANLEIRAEKIKEERIEAEKRRIERENEDRLRREYKEKQDAEKKEFKTLFRMAERLNKTQILRQYISSFEEFLISKGEMDEVSASKIEWAKSKADWLDPFISRSDKYLDPCDKSELIQPECPKKDSWGYSSYSEYYSAPKYSFWSNPWRNRK
ncbi:MAG: hypothetical protein ABR974_05010 [Bacteroidales bacterium]|jgi:hypothetical protein